MNFQSTKIFRHLNNCIQNILLYNILVLKDLEFQIHQNNVISNKTVAI